MTGDYGLWSTPTSPKPKLEPVSVIYSGKISRRGGGRGNEDDYRVGPYLVTECPPRICVISL